MAKSHRFLSYSETRAVRNNPQIRIFAKVPEEWTEPRMPALIAV